MVTGSAPAGPETSIATRPAPASRMASLVDSGVDRLLESVCIKRTPSRIVFRFDPGRIVDLIGFVVLVGLMAFIRLLFTVAVVRSPYYSPLSLVEEAAYTYTTATNFVRFGYWNSTLLQDFSNASSPLDHPYVYNHMPAGPDILQAVLLQIS